MSYITDLLYKLKIIKPTLTVNNNDSVNSNTEINNTKINQKTSVYIPITDHVYFNGSSYRVRFSKKNLKISKSFRSSNEAISFKNKYLV